MNNKNRARRLEAVKRHADTILAAAGDIYRDDPTPLFSDYVDQDTMAPGIAGMPEFTGDPGVMSNFAHQQDLMRTLAGLSAVTGDAKYIDRAHANYRYHFDHLMLPNGLFRWGGHRYVDLRTLHDLGVKGSVHELKNDFPFYELMYEVDPTKAEIYIKSFWNAHVYEWDAFEIGRHGRDNGRGIDHIWERSFGDPAPFTPRKGLSFMNTGNDLMYSAAKLYKTCGDAGAARWGENLYHMYVKSRHPKTGLGVYQFTQPIQQKTTDDFRLTDSMYGDRAKRQCGPELGADCLEGNMLTRSTAFTIYALNPQVICEYAEAGTENAAKMLEWARSGLEAFMKYAYIAETNEFRPLLADGQDLTGFVLRRDGYYGPAGRVFTRYPAGVNYLPALLSVAARTGDRELWAYAGKISSANGLGELGEAPGKPGRLNYETACASDSAVAALVHLYRQYPAPEYLSLASRIADNIVDALWHGGCFAASATGLCSVNISAPLALLELEAALSGREAVPTTVYRSN